MALTISSNELLSSSWSFENALHILQQKDYDLLPVLQKYLEANEKILLNPFQLFFRGEKEDFRKITQADLDKPTIDINGVSYSLQGVEKSILKADYVESLSKRLDVVPEQVVRVIVHTHEKKILDLYDIGNVTSHISLIPTGSSKDGKLSDLSKISMKSAKNIIYGVEILKEKRQLIRLLTAIFKNQTLNSFLQDLADKVLSKNESLLKSLMTYVCKCVDELTEEEMDRDDIESSAALGSIIKKELLLVMSDCIKLMVQILIPINPSESLVKRWFELLNKSQYFGRFHVAIQSLGSVVTLLFLGLQVDEKIFNIKLPYLDNPEMFKYVEKSIVGSSSPIAIYSWSIINYARYLVFESFPEDAKKFLDGIGSDLELFKHNVTQFIILAEKSRNGIFESLLEMYKSLDFDNVYQIILASYIRVILPFIRLDHKSAFIISQILQSVPENEDLILDDSFLKHVQLNKLKSPEDLSSLNSFICLLCVDGKLAYTVLEQLDTYLHFFEQGDLDYEDVTTPENNTLTNNNLLVSSDTSNSLVSTNNATNSGNNSFVTLSKDTAIKSILEPPTSNNYLLFKAGTQGKLVGKNVIIFKYIYNGWSLVGKVFENLINEMGEGRETVQENETKWQKDDLLVNVVSLLINTISLLDKNEVDSLIKHLESSTSVEFFELLYKAFHVLLMTKDLDRLVLLNPLLVALLDKKYSTEVWSILIKSNYFGVNNSLVLNLIFSAERTRGKFDFSVSLCKLADAVIIDSLSIKSSNNVSLNVKEEIITQITFIFINSYENFLYWNYNDISQRYELGVSILNYFSKILFAIYSISLNTKDDAETNCGVTLILNNAGTKIINSFLKVDDSLTLRPFLVVIDLLISQPTQIDENINLWLENFVYCIFDFTRLVVSLRSLLKLDVSMIETNIFSNLKTLINIYIKYPNLKLKVMNLIIVLITNQYAEKPPSLLAHLGNNHSKILLNSMIVDLEGSLIEFRLKNALYDFFSNVMEKNQEGLSILLLTGYDIHEKKKTKNDRSILHILKTNVMNLDKYPDSVAIHLLDAISFAFNSWATAQKIDDDDQKFVEALATYFNKNADYIVEENELEDLSDTADKTIKGCYRVKLVSSIAEILALYLFSCSNEKIVKPILNLLENPNFLKSHASNIFKIHNYKSNLHLTTHKNFHIYFPNFKLDDFFRTPLNKSRRYGVSTIYNLSLMDQLFGAHYEWNDFLRHDVIQTSLNLQYVSAQTNMIKSWGALISSYVRFKNNIPTSEFIDLASLLLSINNQEGIPAPSFREIYLERIELAFFLVYNLTSTDHSVKITDDQISTLFEAVVSSLLPEELNFLVNLSNNDVQLYRSLLRILLITLNLCSNKAYLLEKNINLLIELFSKIIANGSKVIIANVQNEMSFSSEVIVKNNGKLITDSTKNIVSPLVINKIEDLLLIISIFKAFVAINFSTAINESLSILLDSSETIKYIMELYTYSYSLLVDGEPIFADLALIYIIELISIDAVADKLLNYGLFSALINSPISIEIQKGNIRSDRQPRYHHIWSNGLLTIVLILISKFGPRVIPDVCTFLVQFEKQISFTLKNWTENSLVITTPTIHETSQLILLYKALDLLNFKEYIGINLNNESLSNLQFFPGLETPKQRQKLIHSFNHLLAHPKYLQSRIVITSAEDQLVNEDAGKGKTKLTNRLINEIRELSESLAV